MSEFEWLDIFGDNLKSMLVGAGMTQTELAEEAGISKANISKYVNKQQMPTIKSIINIAYAIDCSIDDLIDFGEHIR